MGPAGHPGGAAPGGEGRAAANPYAITITIVIAIAIAIAIYKYI